MSNNFVSSKLVGHLAKILNLKISKKEFKKLKTQLTKTVDYIKILDELNIMQTKSSYQPIKLSNVFRKDVANSSLNQKEALSQAKGTKKGYFKVGAILNDSTE